MPGIAARRAIIIDLLTVGPVPSQEELRAGLASRGVRVTQATLSRDLRELGCVKGPAGYQLADGPAMPPANGAAPRSDAAARYVTAVELAGTLVVVRTGPGQANAVAAEFDAAQTERLGVLGTIAGDDTVFVACRTDRKAKAVRTHLSDAAGLDRSPQRMSDGAA